MNLHGKFIFYLVLISSFLTSCASLYIDEDRQDCVQNIIGRWQSYEVFNTLLQLQPTKKTDSINWVINEDRIIFDRGSVLYDFINDCDGITFKTKDRNISFRYWMKGNDTLILSNRPLIHEEYMLKFKRIK